MKKMIFLLLMAVVSLHAGEIKIAVAANVSYAIEALKTEFAKSHPDTKVSVLLGSSGKLTAQITNGAPFDIFMSANMKYPKALYTEKIAVTKPEVYAQGALAMFSVKALDFSKGIAFTNESNIKKIAIANPKTAPYGAAAVEVLTKSNLLKSIENKFVYAESITQAVQYAMTAADMGFVAKSSLKSDTMAAYKEGINYVDVDPNLYTPIKQGIVILKHGMENQEAKAFYDFIFSDEAKAIFEKFGYIIQKEEATELEAA